MSSIFPIREKVSLDREPEPRLVDLDEDTADEVFEALASTTTRKIFLELHNQPQTASDLAEVTETSVQNVQYHLEKLTDVELVEVVDTWYSERGSEMKVYAPQDESLVLFAGRDKRSAFRRLLNRFAGVFAMLVPPSILAGWLANRNDSTARESINYEVADSGSPDADGAAGDDVETTDAVTRDSDGGQTDDGAATDEEGMDGDAAEEDADSATPEPETTPEVEADGGQIPEEGVEDQNLTTSKDVDSEYVQVEFDNATEAADFVGSQNDTVYLAVDNGGSEIMGIDPAVAVAFFLGGLLVYGAVLARRRWY